MSDEASTPDETVEAAIRGEEQKQRKEIIVAASDPLLRPFLTSLNRREAQSCFERLHSEFMGPIVTRVLTHELRREVHTNAADLYRENDTFQDISLLVRGKMASRLDELWEVLNSAEPEKANVPEGITNLNHYTASVARHACVDYFRRKRPGRHALDTALRTAFDIVAELHLWQINADGGVREWLCGRLEWSTNPVGAVALRFDDALQRRLQSALSGRSRAEALREIWSVTNAPLRYVELLNFLSDLWDVEAGYATNRSNGADLLPVQRAYLSGLRPEETVELMGALQSLWRSVQPLNSHQAAVLLFKMPQYEAGTFLDAMVRMQIADWPDIARAMGIPVQRLWRLSEIMPLDDETIANVLELNSATDVARIRQDARRRMERQRKSQNEENK